MELHGAWKFLAAGYIAMPIMDPMRHLLYFCALFLSRANWNPQHEPRRF